MAIATMSDKHAPLGIAQELGIRAVTIDNYTEKSELLARMARASLDILLPLSEYLSDKQQRESEM